MHKMVAVPAGMSLADFAPAFSEVEHAVHLGELNTACPSCRKDFTAARKPRRSILIAWPDLALPVALSYRICGSCLFKFRAGGAAKDGVLASIEAYIDGAEASQ